MGHKQWQRFNVIFSNVYICLCLYLFITLQRVFMFFSAFVLYIEVYQCEQMNRCVFCAVLIKFLLLNLKQFLVFFPFRLLNGAEWRCQYNKKKQTGSARLQVPPQFLWPWMLKRLQRRKQMCEWAARSAASSDRWQTRCMNVNDFLADCTFESQSHKKKKTHISFGWTPYVVCSKRTAQSPNLWVVTFVSVSRCIKTFMDVKSSTNQSLFFNWRLKIKTDASTAALRVPLTAIIYFICSTCVSVPLCFLDKTTYVWD